MAVVGRNNGSIFLPEGGDSDRLGAGCRWKTKEGELDSCSWCIAQFGLVLFVQILWAGRWRGEGHGGFLILGHKMNNV